ncbi:MAG: hypothetical protein QXN55_00860 [Candidatus Nitrosotenuis sp.]
MTNALLDDIQELTSRVEHSYDIDSIENGEWCDFQSIDIHERQLRRLKSCVDAVLGAIDTYRLEEKIARNCS